MDERTRQERPGALLAAPASAPPARSARARAPLEPGCPVFGARQVRSFEANPRPMRIFDRETLAYLAVNDAALRLYGYTREEFLALKLTDTRHPDEHGPLWAALARPAEYIVHRGDRRHVTKSGEVLTVETITQDIVYAGRPARLSLTIDLTGRLRTQELLWKRQQEFESLADNLPDLVARYDRERRFLYANSAIERLFGAGRWQLIGKTQREAGLPREMAASYDASLTEVLATRKPHKLEFRVTLARGDRHFEAYHVPEFDAAGAVASVLCIARDITARKQAESDRIKSAVRQRDALVREVHHRIKNGLQGIIGLLRQKLGKHPGVKPEIEEAIVQLQTVAVVYGLQGTRADGHVSLAELVAAICASAEGLTGGRVDRSCEFSSLRRARIGGADAVPLAVALNELVFNALKHQPGGAGRRRARVLVRENAHQVELRIGNRGRLPRGFDFAAPATLGNGLGLVRALLDTPGCATTIGGGRGEVEAVLTITPPLLAGWQRRRVARRSDHGVTGKKKGRGASSAGRRRRPAGAGRAR